MITLGCHGKRLICKRVSTAGEGSDLNSIPAERAAFLHLIDSLFPRADLSGLVIRTIAPPGSGPTTTVVCVTDLMPAGDLERLVLAPLAGGGVAGPPERLMESGRFPAARVRCAADSDSLVAGLMEGLAAIHTDGHAGVLLAGSGLQGGAAGCFSTDLAANVATLHRQLRRVDLQAEYHTRADGSRIALVYLLDRSAPETVQAVRTWGLNLSDTPAALSGWQALLNLFRLPPALAASTPAAVAEALTNGYVALFRDNAPDPQVAPTTLDRLFTSPGDMAFPPAIRRVITWPRVVAALISLTLSAGLVAASSYHHSLVPAPFLVALATSRSNLPLPVVGEMLLVALISDAFGVAAARAGGRRLAVAALIATVFTLTAMMQVGVLGGVSGVAGMVDGAVRATLPSGALRRIVRLWRYFYIGAAAGLGLYGMALLLFLTLVYLAEERVLEHPVRLPPAAVSS